jgi:hypothetical protein
MQEKWVSDTGTGQTLAVLVVYIQKLFRLNLTVGFQGRSIYPRSLLPQTSKPLSFCGDVPMVRISGLKARRRYECHSYGACN